MPIDTKSDAPADLQLWLGLIAILVIYSIGIGGAILGLAGSWHYPAGQRFLWIFLGGCWVLSLFFLLYDPSLIRRRIMVGPTAEERPAQKLIQSYMAVLILGELGVPPLLYRWGYVGDSWLLSWLGCLFILIGWIGFTAVFIQNKWAAATVRVERDQKLISTGLYGMVRHPMYSFAIIYFFGLPLSLGDPYTATVGTLVMLPGLVWRLVDEEKTLETDLAGYTEYKRKVPYRLIPHLY